MQILLVIIAVLLAILKQHHNITNNQKEHICITDYFCKLLNVMTIDK